MEKGNFTEFEPTIDPVEAEGSQPSEIESRAVMGRNGIYHPLRGVNQASEQASRRNGGFHPEAQTMPHGEGYLIMMGITPNKIKELGL